MVWVSNQSSGAITVLITGGNNKTYTIAARVAESWTDNHWQRSGRQTVNIHFDSGKEASFPVNENDHVNIYDNGYETFTAHAVHLS